MIDDNFYVVLLSDGCGCISAPMDGCVPVLCCKDNVFFASKQHVTNFFYFFCQKIWLLIKKAVILHPLLEMTKW